MSNECRVPVKFLGVYAYANVEVDVYVTMDQTKDVKPGSATRIPASHRRLKFHWARMDWSTATEQSWAQLLNLLTSQSAHMT